MRVRAWTAPSKRYIMLTAGGPAPSAAGGSNPGSASEARLPDAHRAEAVGAATPAGPVECSVLTTSPSACLYRAMIMSAKIADGRGGVRRASEVDTA